jgi:hypothetical protein
MDKILKSIATQANLDRILFTPAIKKLYFSMAMASGGATQFKHADSIRNGLTYAADKATDNKHVLLFCSIFELPAVYDLFIKYAETLTPVMVLALRTGTDARCLPNWALQDFGGTGWLQFHTHTNQELYDHLAMGYYLFEEKKVKIPILIVQSSPDHDDLGEFTEKENLNLGNPLTGLQSGRATKKLDFDAAIRAAKTKKDKPTLRVLYQGLETVLRDGYQELGYTLPDAGLPCLGDSGEAETAIVSFIPAHADGSIHRLLCYRPFFVESLLARIGTKKVIAVVEPQPSPGTMIPPFYGEILGSLPLGYDGRVLSICTKSETGILSQSHIQAIYDIVSVGGKESGECERFYSL